MQVLHVLADKWASALVKAQFSPGLQGFLQLLGLTELQEALVKWICIIYPWQVGGVFKDLGPKNLRLGAAYDFHALTLLTTERNT